MALVALAAVTTGCGIFRGTSSPTDSEESPGLAGAPRQRSTLTETAPVTSTVPGAAPVASAGPIEPAATMPPLPDSENLPAVHIELEDGRIVVDQTSLTIAIPYRFVITNRGKQLHSLEVRTASIGGQPPSPVFSLQGGPLKPGQSAEVFVGFRLPGPYQLVCPLEGHRDAGEIASIGVL
jgi:hypothetical protein